jgi:hypothetical protein
VPDDEKVMYEIFVRKGDNGGPFVVENPAVYQNYTAMLSIAKDLVNQKDVDEAVLLQKRVLKRFRKYGGQG